MNRSANVSQISLWLDRAILFWIFVLAAFAPHSIAVTQGAWLLGLLCWIVRYFVYPPPKIYRTPIDYAMLGFFILSGISSVVSYEPGVSIGKLRAASLFTIVYLVAENVPSRKLVRLLAVTLIASCMINVCYTAVTRVVGRGVKIHGIKAASPLANSILFLDGRMTRSRLLDGDTMLEVDGQRVSNADEVVAKLSASPNSLNAVTSVYRTEFVYHFQVPRGRLLPGNSAEEELGISSWSRGRDWRAAGFYGLYVTYAEALQLILSLALGLFICVPRKGSRSGILLLIAIAGMGIALLLTVTRASWLAFLISATVMVLLGTSRRVVLIAGACAIPLVLGGLFLLKQYRHVGFIDQSDGSTTWRETVWHEGFDLLISKPRHLVVGVGMDSLKRHWRAWGLFDKGRLPWGHMHSNPLQIALERGVPALIVWLILLGLYARALWRALWELEQKSDPENERLNRENGPELISAPGEWADRGIVLGALGGLAGFFTSGLVHYNWGDSEVVMIFYFIMGLSLVLVRQAHPVRENGNARG